MSWACDAYNRTATVSNPGNRSPHEMFYGEIPQNSPIPFLKPGYCKYKRMNKMGPKARICFYLGSTKNHPRDSKRVFVLTGKVIITRNVTWAHVRSRRSLITGSKPSVVGEGDASGQDRVGDCTGCGRGGHARGGVRGGCRGVYRNAHGKNSALAATSNNASRVITAPLPESV